MCWVQANTEGTVDAVYQMERYQMRMNVTSLSFSYLLFISTYIDRHFLIWTLRSNKISAGMWWSGSERLGMILMYNSLSLSNLLGSVKNLDPKFPCSNRMFWWSVEFLLGIVRPRVPGIHQASWQIFVFISLHNITPLNKIITKTTLEL